MYEPPYNPEKTSREIWKEYRKNLKQALKEGRKGDAVGHFMMLVGMPAEQLEEMQQHPMWPLWEAVAPTLEYDAEALGEEADIPLDRAARVKVPTVIMCGSQTFPFMHHSAKALAEAMPHGEYRILTGQTHEVSAEAIAPALVEFFSS
jgi:pimeloyl-ACP methyl ester carboxylesterase